MSEIKDGGPAFARAGNEWADMERVPAEASGGMTLRDYFAAKAMQAYLSGEDRDEFGYGEWATASYSMADAMLKARSES